jgi:hypothetical protein
MLDLTPQGRGNWYASLGYGTRRELVIASLRVLTSAS